MDIFQAITLALVQGLTEFLPISSSAHLVLLPALMEWQDQGLVFDVAVHFGTLSAVIFHYRSCIVSMFRLDPQAVRYACRIVIASLPVLICGYFLENITEQHLRAPLVIATTSIVFGLLLWAATWYETATPSRKKNSSDLKLVFLIGTAQVLALVPGTSRAGIAVTAGLFLGLPLRTAVQVSFALAIPVILAASAYQGTKIITGLEFTTVPWSMLILGFCISAVTAFATIRLMLALLSTLGLLPFIVYRLILGIILFAIFL